MRAGEVPADICNRLWYLTGGYVGSKDRQRCERNLYEFVQAAWPIIDSSEFEHNWALQAFCEHLEAVTAGQIPRLLANYPPRCAKTTIASICWPVWTWVQQERSFLSGPRVRFLCGSYSAMLSLQNATKARRLILSPWFQANWGHRFTLREDQNTKGQFDNTEGGSRISTSVGGSLLGLGGDVIVIDDPHNTETERLVETDADRKKVASWWQEIHSTRLNDPKQSAIVVVMQRLHEGDLSGLILDSEEEWTHLMIPMEFDAQRCSVTVKLWHERHAHRPWRDERMDKYEQTGVDGELMWEERFGPREVANLKAALGPYLASGRLQQMPVPKGGGIIQRDWWLCWGKDEALRYGLVWNTEKGALKQLPETSLVVASLDTAFKEKEENDWNALTIWGLWTDKNRNRRAMLMYAWQKRLGLHGKMLERWPQEIPVQFNQRQQAEWGLVEWVAYECKRWKVTRLLIEDKARGHDVANELRRLYARENWGIEMIEPEKDKVSRAHACVPLFVDGAIWAPDTKWAEMVINQCAQFPKATHDDLVDTATQFVNWARVNELLSRSDEMTLAMEEDMRVKPRPMSVAESYGV